MYHEVEEASKVDKRYTLSEVAFKNHLRYLQEQEFQTVLLNRDWNAAKVEALAAKGHEVAITFDDSHINHFANSLPLLQRYQARATFFVVTSLVGADRAWLDRNQLAALAKAGMAVQSHTHTHRFLDVLGPNDLRDELLRSKQLLEDWLGLPVQHLSCPGGRYNRRVLGVAEEVGYHTVSTSVPGLARPARLGDITVLPRFLITSGTTQAQFEHAVFADAAYIRRRRTAYTARHVVKRCLGDQLYQRLWQSLSRSDEAKTASMREE